MFDAYCGAVMTRAERASNLLSSLLARKCDASECPPASPDLSLR
jgi:hypothetical protein